jgi:hypothetical protein
MPIQNLGRVTKQVFVSFDGTGVRRDVMGVHDVLWVVSEFGHGVWSC